MHNEDQQLLRRFATGRDEAAFETLVRRHLGLVLGAARRQLAGDHHAAEDVAQQVFTLLAQKAGRLLRHNCLEAWLHTATRFACQTHIRTAVRRERREQEVAMNLATAGGESLWEKVGPVLDEALSELGEQDRGLILMRHVKQQSSEEMAARLGVSEPAARKRVERALTRLRGCLAKRGIAIGVVALAGAMELNAQAQVSPGLVSQIAGHAAAQAGAAAGATAWLAWLKPAVIVGAAALICAVAILLPRADKQSTVQPVPTGPTVSVVAATQATASEPDTATNRPAAEVRQFMLNIVDAETHLPLTGASATFWVGYDEHSQQRIDERAWASNGPVRVTWTNDCLRFHVQVECEGYADTYIEWAREQGVLPVPESWTLLMERAPTIGGVVVDEQGSPVPSASVAVWVSGELTITVPGTKQPTLSYPARIIDNNVTAQTDANGCWAIRRIARAVQNIGMTIVVTHPDYLYDRSDLKPGNSLPALQAETYRSVLKRQESVTVTGIVRDPAGNPLPHAQVTDGTLFSKPGTFIEGDQRLTTDTNGAFSFSAGSGAKIHVTAKADGFAAKTVAWSGQPLAITLQPGRTLHLRVVNPDGNPIAGVRAQSTQFQHTGGSETNQSTYYQLEATTDADGRVEWADVPNEPLLFTFWADLPDYNSRVGEVLQPDELEQTIVLTPALKVAGLVTDAETGAPVPMFHVASVDVFGTDGIPPAPPFALPDTISGKPFEAGRFELKLKPGGGYASPSLNGPRERQRHGSYLKITAPGYAAYTSRYLDVKEGQVQIQAALKRAANARVQIVNPSGYAVVGADVVACSASGGLNLNRGAWTLSGDYVLTTDANGWFELPADNRLQFVAVMDRARTLLGWATMDTLRREGSLKLTQLHRLELFPAQAGAAQSTEGCDVKLTSPVLEQLTGDASPLWSRCDGEGKCVFVGLPAGTYQATLLAREGAKSPEAGKNFTIELAADAPALVRCELPAGGK